MAVQLPYQAVSESTDATEKLGAALGRYLLEQAEPDAFLALYGDLGAGKTALVRGLASVLTPSACVSSPTYALVHEYREGARRLYHFDMYRITDEEDLYSIGFYDYRDGVLAVEWCENIPYALPSRYYAVTVEKLENDARRITIEEKGIKEERT